MQAAVNPWLLLFFFFNQCQTVVGPCPGLALTSHVGCAVKLWLVPMPVDSRSPSCHIHFHVLCIGLRGEGDRIVQEDM